VGIHGGRRDEFATTIFCFGSVDCLVFYRSPYHLDAAAFGFRKVIIKPYVPEDLNYVSASVNTIRGLVSSSWRKEADALVLDVVFTS